MRRINSILAVAAAMVAMMVFAGPAFASTNGSCIQIPFSPLMTHGAPPAFTALLLQFVVVGGIVLVAAVALTPTFTVRSSTPAGTPQAAS
jgi:hypothetical protein